MTNSQTIRTAWKNYTKEHKVTADDMVLLAALKAIHAKTNNSFIVFRGILQKSFSPTTNSIKLANGQRKWQGFEDAYNQARYRLRSHPFNGVSVNRNQKVHPLIEECVKSEINQASIKLLFDEVVISDNYLE